MAEDIFINKFIFEGVFFMSTRRTWAKQKLRKLGCKTEGKYLEEFRNFIIHVDLIEDPTGLLFEYALAYIFGVFQKSYGEKHFRVTMTDQLDDVEKVDFLINNHRLQVKLDWDESKLPLDKETQYKLFNIKLLTFYRKDKNGNNACGIDIIRDILATCGFSEELIEELVDENPAFDAAEEILSNWLFLA